MTFPASGDGAVVVHGGSFESSVGSLTPNPILLDPTRLKEVIGGKVESSDKFAKVRSSARARSPQLRVDWAASIDYLESIRRPRMDAGLFVRKRPGGVRPAIRATPACASVSRQADAPNGTHPVDAGGTARSSGGERRRYVESWALVATCSVLSVRARLVDRLRKAARIKAIAIPGGAGQPAPTNPAPVPGNESVSVLERAVERAALRRAEGAIGSISLKWRLHSPPRHRILQGCTPSLENSSWPGAPRTSWPRERSTLYRWPSNTQPRMSSTRI